MPTSCCANGCVNRHKPGGKIQFFGFPLQNARRLPQWLEAINRDNFVPTKASKLCSAHFTHSDYLVRPNTYIQRLKPDAVPSIFKSPHKSSVQIAEIEFVVCDVHNLVELKTNEDKPELGTRKKAEVKILTVYCNDKGVQTAGPPLPYTNAGIRFLKLRMKTLNQQLRRKIKKLHQLENLLEAMEDKQIIQLDRIHQI